VRIVLLAVGRARALFADPLTEYEKRLGRYFNYRVVEIREQTAGGATSPARVMGEEGKRILAKLPAGYQLVALDRRGESWSSERLAAFLDDAALRAMPGVAFAIGGAFGLSDDVLARADRRLSLSDLTFPHEMARVILTEQLYRAGTIQRGEPYHKGGQT
jgi:23S rRNA (pseudouridine1915-N3)-methyltransferase